MVEAQPIPTNPRFIDMTGSPPFGRLRVLYFTRTQPGRGALWLVLCDPELGGCGREFEVRGGDLRSGNTKSCGCLHRELMADRLRTHGFYHLQEYGIWRGMKGRCLNPRHKNYHYYSGIEICERWLGPNGFENFLVP